MTDTSNMIRIGDMKIERFEMFEELQVLFRIPKYEFFNIHSSISILTYIRDNIDRLILAEEAGQICYPVK